MRAHLSVALLLHLSSIHDLSACWGLWWPPPMPSMLSPFMLPPLLPEELLRPHPKPSPQAGFPFPFGKKKKNPCFFIRLLPYHHSSIHPIDCNTISCVYVLSPAQEASPQTAILIHITAVRWALPTACYTACAQWICVKPREQRHLELLQHSSCMFFSMIIWLWSWSFYSVAGISTEGWNWFRLL